MASKKYSLLSQNESNSTQRAAISLSSASYYQSGAAASPSSSSSSSSTNRASSSNMSRLGPNAAIAELIQNLSRRNGKLERMAQRLGGAQDNTEYRASLNEERSNAQSLCKRIMMELQHSHDNTAMVKKLAQDFQVGLKRFKKVNEQIEHQLENIVLAMSQSQADHTSPLAGVDQKQQQALAEIDVQFRTYDLEAINKTKEAVQLLESDVAELAEMFEDLHKLVHEQQEDLDHISDNVNAVRVKVEEGHKEVEKADEYDRKAKKRTCMLAILALIIIGAVVAIVVVVKK
jgi:predicted  nucleic acid-binding Zn-ribbon protein